MTQNHPPVEKGHAIISKLYHALGTGLPHRVTSPTHMDYASLGAKWFHSLRRDTIELHMCTTGQRPMKMTVAVMAGEKDEAWGHEMVSNTDKLKKQRLAKITI